jgi:hypothetical protein
MCVCQSLEIEDILSNSLEIEDILSNSLEIEDILSNSLEIEDILSNSHAEYGGRVVKAGSTPRTDYG